MNKIYFFHIYTCFLISQYASGDVDLELDLIQKRYSLAVNMSNATNTDTFGYVEYKVADRHDYWSNKISSFFPIILERCQ